MGLFSSFFNKTKSLKIEDDIFGPLLFMDVGNEDKNYFEGAGLFMPTNREIEYFITADKNGPTQEQRDFYVKIQDNYKILIGKAMPLLVNEIRKFIKKGFNETDFENGFTLVSLSIPVMSNKPVNWEMSFTSKQCPKHLYTIIMRDMEPINQIIADG